MTQSDPHALPSDSQKESSTAGALRPHVLAADIGGSNLRLALATERGQIVGRWRTTTRDLMDAEGLVERMRQGAQILLAEAGLPAEAIKAVAAGAPGVTDTDRGVVTAAAYMAGWLEVPLRNLLEQAFGVPAAVENDVNAAALGEARAGAALGEPDFVLLAIGTGIGAGVVSHGRLHHGARWAAGEVGYLLLPGTSTEPVTASDPGPFERAAGGEGIHQLWLGRWDPAKTTLDREASATEVFEAAGRGDALAGELLESVARVVAYALYNMAAILDCPLFVLGGSVGVHPALVERTRTVLLGLNPLFQPRLEPSSLGGDAQLVGVVHLALDLLR